MSVPTLCKISRIHSWLVTWKSKGCPDRISWILSIVGYLPSGALDVGALVAALTSRVVLNNQQCTKLINLALREAWDDGYTHGWSDGSADRIPKDRGNPYGPNTPPSYDDGVSP